MPNYNSVQVMGHIVRDLELKHTNSEKAVVSFTVAINDFKDKVTFVDVTAWEKTAEACAKYLSKGKPVFVEGRLETQSWEKDGEKRSKLAVVAKSVQFLGKKEGGDEF